MKHAQITATAQPSSVIRRAFTSAAVAVSTWHKEHRQVNDGIRLASCRFPQERAQGVHSLAQTIQGKRRMPLLDFISNPEEKARSQLMLMLGDSDEKVRTKAVAEVRKLKLNKGDINAIEMNLLYPISEAHAIALLDSLGTIKEPATGPALLACADKWLDSGNERILNAVSHTVAKVGFAGFNINHLGKLALAFTRDRGLHTREGMLAEVVFRCKPDL